MRKKLETYNDFIEAPYKEGYIRSTILYLLSLGELDLGQYNYSTFAINWGFMFNYIR